MSSAPSTVPMPSVCAIIVRSDLASRRYWSLPTTIVYYIGLALFVLVNVYVAVRSSEYRGVGIVLLIVALVFEMGVWQLRRASIRRMEEGGRAIVAKLYAEEALRRAPSQHTAIDSARKPEPVDGKDPGANAEEMARTVVDLDDERHATTDAQHAVSPRSKPVETVTAATAPSRHS